MKPAVVERAHGGGDVHVPLAKKTLVEDRDRALHVSEVHVEQVGSRLHEVPHGRQHVFAHLRPAAHAEIQPVVGAVSRFAWLV